MGNIKIGDRVGGEPLNTNLSTPIIGKYAGVGMWKGRKLQRIKKGNKIYYCKAVVKE